jgi:hypothetical protein
MFEIVQIFDAIGALSPKEKTRNRAIDCTMVHLRNFLLKPEVIRNAGWVDVSLKGGASACYRMKWAHQLCLVNELEPGEEDCSYEMRISRRPGIGGFNTSSYSVSIIYLNRDPASVELDLGFTAAEELQLYEDFKAGAEPTGNRIMCSALVLLFLDIEERVHFEEQSEAY